MRRLVKVPSPLEKLGIAAVGREFGTFPVEAEEIECGGVGAPGEAHRVRGRQANACAVALHHAPSPGWKERVGAPRSRKARCRQDKTRIWRSPAAPWSASNIFSIRSSSE